MRCFLASMVLINLFFLVSTTDCVSNILFGSLSEQKQLLSHIAPSDIDPFPDKIMLPELTPDSAEKQILRLNILQSRLLCSESDCHQHKNNCSLEIEYTISSNGKIPANIDASITCKAKLRYKTRHGYDLTCEQCIKGLCRLNQSTLRHDDKVVIEFPFSIYEEVVDTHLESLECSIDDVVMERLWTLKRS